MMKRTYADRHFETAPDEAMASSQPEAMATGQEMLPSSQPEVMPLSQVAESGSQKRKADPGLISSRYAPAESKRRVTDRIMKGMHDENPAFRGCGGDGGEEGG